MANNRLSNLTKRQVRYWCFRFKTEADGIRSAEGAPEGLKRHFESLEWFTSWKDFTVTWDVVESSPLQIRPLKESAEKIWNRVLEENAKELPFSYE